MWTKICANTNLADALIAVEAGADAVGFVFAPGSKRQVTANQVEEMIDGLPPGVEKVGVFTTVDPFEVEKYVARTGLTAAQLHVAFNPEMARTLSAEFGSTLKIIQTVAYIVDAPDRTVADEEFQQTLRAAFAEPALWAVLVDAGKCGRSGGLGVAFDWRHVGGLVRNARDQANGESHRVILAGGLRPDTVAEAIAAFDPWGVDVASSVEASPGRKEPVLVRYFVTAARNASGS